MLTEAQTNWCMQKAGIAPSSLLAAVNFLFVMGQKYWPVQIEITDSRFIVYSHNKMGKGADIQVATEDLVNRLNPVPDIDPYLVENLIETLAPGTYPTYADKVSAAEIRSKAEAEGHFLVGV